MNLTDLERELDAACGGKSLADVNFEKSQILKDCHKLLASYVGATYHPGKLAEWGMKRVELMERIESVVKP